MEKEITHLSWTFWINEEIYNYNSATWLVLYLSIYCQSEFLFLMYKFTNCSQLWGFLNNLGYFMSKIKNQTIFKNI